MRYYLAIDIGASSGRHIVGWRQGGTIQTREVYRFPNGMRTEENRLTWDIVALLTHVKQGIAAAKAVFPEIHSLSIDTWGVDYVLFRGEQEVLPVYAYRDSRTEETVPLVHGAVDFPALYARTGCQFQPFNTVYQLYHDKISGRLEGVTDLLMMPEYLMYKLCGTKAREYTNATTTGMVNVRTGEFDGEILQALGYPTHLFPKLSRPGTVIGEYGGIKVVLCATHDTASAVEGIPMEGNHPYISSGTWSLLGVKTASPITDEKSREANYSNEGGVGYHRYQKNIMGMWLVNELRRELCPETDFAEIVKLAEASTCEAAVDANAPELLAPESMKAAFDALTGNTLRTTGDYFCCAYRSIAASYGQAIRELEANTAQTYEKLYLVGGGAKNTYLNRLAGQYTGKEVIALPIEATVLGNLKIQMECDDHVL
ncbi:MAG: rhamnulokinase [Clostridia bacterium]|nr:rhamnulokinase [Clostridia bacterium]